MLSWKQRERRERKFCICLFCVHDDFCQKFFSKICATTLFSCKNQTSKETTKRRKFDREFFQEREERDLVFRFILRYSREENVCEITCKCTRIPREQTYWREEEEDLLVRKNSSQITNSFFVFQPQRTNESIKNRMTQKISFVSPSFGWFLRELSLFSWLRAKSSARESFGNEYVSIPSEGRNTYLVDELQTTNVFGSLILSLIHI